ncbi:MAG: UDP-2,3-diacylglucosamine diphosphatase LpxI [Mariprofundaceae bacterium]
MPQPSSLGLIAGYGSFPLTLARSLLNRGIDVHAVAAVEETSPEIEKHTTSTQWLHVGKIGGMIKVFKKHGVTQIIMAGKVQKLRLFQNFRPDMTAIKILASLSDHRDDTLLNAICDELAKHKLEVISQLTFAGEMLAPKGVIVGKKPNTSLQRNIEFGYQQARGIAALDIGQTVLIRDSAVLAVEAIEGTDAAIRRGGALGHGKATVIKVAKPNQDPRFDVPTIGPDTLKVMSESGVNLLAVEAHKTIILELERVHTLAKEYGISVFGMVNEDLS